MTIKFKLHKLLRKIISLSRNYAKLISLIPRERVRLSVVLIVLLVVSGIVETLSVALIYPLLQSLTQSLPNQDISSPLNGASIFNFYIPFDIKYTLLLFSGFTILSACLRLYSLWMTEKTTSLIGTDLSSLAFRTSLHRPYSWLNTFHTSDLVSSLSTDISQVITGILTPIFLTINSLALLMGIILTIIAIDWQIFLLLSSVILAIYLFILSIAIPHTKAQGIIRIYLTKKLYKTMMESLSGIVQVKSFEIENDMAKIYKETDFKLRRSIAKVNFLSQFPKITVESFAILTLIIGSASIVGNEANNSNIAVLGLVAFGSQKLIPVCQLLYFNFIKIYNSRANLANYLLYVDDLDNQSIIQPNDGFAFSQSSVPTRLTIKASELRYKYPDASYYAVKNINFSLSPGELVLLQGSSGAGKSTFIKLLLGMITPSSGQISIVNDSLVYTLADEHEMRCLRKLISYVPQNVNLFDTSLLKNITLDFKGDKLIDYQNIKKILELSQLSDFVTSLPLGLETIVGENGSFLSGGQIQRLGVARALFKKADFMILDEPSSSLDRHTEDLLAQSLNYLSASMGILVISHTIPPSLNPSKIYKLINGSLVAVKS